MKQDGKSEKLYDGITDIRDDFIEQAEEPEGRLHKKWRTAAAAAVLAVVLGAGAALWPHGSSVDAAAGMIAEAVYPDTVPYPDETDYRRADGELDDSAFSKAWEAYWEDDMKRRWMEGYENGLDGFLNRCTQQFLSGGTGENRVYSPLNIYMALGMLAELTGGNSRQQILNLLGSGDMESLRKQSSDLWNANYRDNGAVTSILASSLWLNQDVEFNQTVMETIADTYYASSYQGEMGSDAFNRLLQDWLDQQTGGLLKEQASEVEMNADTILALAATVDFHARWHDEFPSSKTKEGVFHADSGDVSCSFMHKDQWDMQYYWGDRFSAVSENLEESGSVWFLLPDEGVGADELLEDAQAMDFLLSQKKWDWKNQKYVMVSLSVPRFDVSAQIKLQEELEKLGVTDVFDAGTADFSPMLADADASDEIYLSQAEHAVRVAVDEEGITAAAFTVMLADAGAAMPEDEVDFVLDRPFLFVVTGSDGLPLFMGVVNQP